MKYFLAIIFCFIFSKQHIVKAQQHSVWLGSPGLLVYANGPLDNTNAYKHNPFIYLPSFNYEFPIKKYKFLLSLMVYDLTYNLNYGFVGLKTRDCSYLNISRVHNILKKKWINFNLLYGLSTKHSSDKVIEGYYSSVSGWDEAYLYNDAHETGGIAVNYGILTKLNIGKSFFITGSALGVNFLAFSKWQRNSIVTNIGLGINIGKDE